MTFDWHMLYPLHTVILDNSQVFGGVPCRAQLGTFSKWFFSPRFGVVPIWELWQFCYVRIEPPKTTSTTQTPPECQAISPPSPFPCCGLGCRATLLVVLKVREGILYLFAGVLLFFESVDYRIELRSAYTVTPRGRCVTPSLLPAMCPLRVHGGIFPMIQGGRVSYLQVGTHLPAPTRSMVGWARQVMEPVPEFVLCL